MKIKVFHTKKGTHIKIGRKRLVKSLAKIKIGGDLHRRCIKKGGEKEHHVMLSMHLLGMAAHGIDARKLTTHCIQLIKINFKSDLFVV